MSQPKCINVETRFPKYKLSYDDPSLVGNRDPWNKRIECKSGHIGPWGDGTLVASTSSARSNASKALKSDPLARVAQDGDDGLNAVFNVEDWKHFFKIMGAKAR